MIFNLFLFLCFYLPFQIALNPMTGVDLASVRVLILVLFFLWLYDKIKNRKRLGLFNIQVKLIFLFLFLSVVSLLFAQNYNWGIRKLLYLFSIFPLYFVAKDLLNNREHLIKALRILVLSGATVSVVGIIQFFVQFFWSYENISKVYSNYIGPVFWGENLAQMVTNYPSWLVGISGQNYFRSIATFPDPHSFSLFLGMMLPLSVILFFISKKKILWALSFVFIFLANILTFSRGGYVAIIAGITIFIVVFWNKTTIKHKLMAGLDKKSDKKRYKDKKGKK